MLLALMPRLCEAGPRAESGAILDLQCPSVPDDRGHVDTANDCPQNCLADPSPA